MMQCVMAMPLRFSGSRTAQQENDTLLLGFRVEMALFAENENYPRDSSRYKHGMNRKFATVRARAKQATEPTGH